jgi:predicted transcriptional regulator
MATTIQISDSTKQTLDKLKIFERETYNEVIENLLEDNLELNERTLKEINERKKSKDWVSMGDVEKHLGL